MDVPDMRDDEAVARWYRSERYGPMRVSWDDTPESIKVSFRQDARLIRALCCEVARKVAEDAYKTGWGHADERGEEPRDFLMAGAVTAALDAILGPATEGE